MLGGLRRIVLAFFTFLAISGPAVPRSAGESPERLKNWYFPSELPHVTAISKAVNVPGKETIFYGGSFNLNGVLLISQPNVTIRCLGGAEFTKSTSPSGIGILADNVSIIGCSVQGAGLVGDNISINANVVGSYLEDVTSQYCGGGSGIVNRGTATRMRHVNASYNSVAGVANSEAGDVDIDDLYAIGNGAEGFTCDNHPGTTCTIRRAYLTQNSQKGGFGNIGVDGQTAVFMEGVTAFDPGPEAVGGHNMVIQNNVGNTLGPRIYNSSFYGARGGDILLNNQATYIPSGAPAIASPGSGYAVGDIIYAPGLLWVQTNNSNVYKVTSIGAGGSVTGISLVSTYPLGGDASKSVANITTSSNKLGTGLTLNITWAATGSYYNVQGADIRGVWSGSENGSVIVPAGAPGFNRISLVSWKVLPSLQDGTSFFDPGGNNTKGALISQGRVHARCSKLRSDARASVADNSHRNAPYSCDHSDRMHVPAREYVQRFSKRQRRC